MLDKAKRYTIVMGMKKPDLQDEVFKLDQEVERLTDLYKDTAALLDAEECDTAKLLRDNDKLKERVSQCLDANQALRQEVERLKKAISTTKVNPA